MTNKRFWLTLAVSLLFTPIAQAAVDMKTANYTETWIDLVAPGAGYDLRVQRTYNSRVIYSGIFGFGWCADLETRLEVTAESNIKVVECGAGAEILYSPKAADSTKADSTVAQIMKEIKSKNPSMSATALREVERDLRSDDFFRESFAQKMGIKGTVDSATTYFANGRENETVQKHGQGFKRTMADSTYQIFDQSGRLTHMYDRAGNYLKLTYDKDRLTGVTDNSGRRLTFTYNKVSGKIERITGPNSLKATYISEGDNLIKATNAGGEVIQYSYDDVHNLTKIASSNGETKAINYNKDKDWVTSFTDATGCIESYDYKINSKNPRAHFWSYVTKRCGKKVTNKSVYEFLHAPRKDGTGLYLKVVRSDINGTKSEVVYHEVFGKPVKITQGDYQIDYSFYENGLIRTKAEPQRRLQFSYETACGKAAKIESEFFDRVPANSRSGSKKIVKKLVTQFKYDPKKCQLIYAENSDGQKIKMSYDIRGRVSRIEDQSKKVLSIKYDERVGKPQLLSRPGLGSVKLVYKKNGDLERADSSNGDPRIATQILSVFNNLLEVMAPAGSEINI